MSSRARVVGDRIASAGAAVSARLVATGAAGLRRPRVAIAAAAGGAVCCAILALGLAPSAAPSLLADPDQGPGAATPAQERTFGGEPIVITAEGDLAARTLTPANLTALLRLEGQAARLDGVRAVFGPATFINQTVVQIEKTVQREIGPIAKAADEAAEAARARARAGGASAVQADERAEAARLETLGERAQEYQELFVRFGYIGLPSLTNRNFILNLVFGADQQPKERFRWLFPDAEHAVVLVRPEPGLGDAELRTLGDRLQTLADRAGVREVDLQVAGAPLVVAGIADEFPVELARLAPVVLLAMVLALLLGLRRGRGRLRLLLLAGGAVLATGAASRLLGLGLTPATVAALPVVLGLAVDYGVQLQARYWAERTAGLDPGPAARAALLRVGPVLLGAAAAMTAGFLALTLSPVPLIDRLGLTLAAGTVASVLVVLLFGAPLLAFRDRRAGVAPELPAGGLRPLSGAGRRGLALAGVLAVAGLLLAGGTTVQSDLTQLAPSGLPELRAAEELQSDLGTAGTLRLAVTGPDLTRADVVAWQSRLEQRVLALDPRLRPGPNLGALLAPNGEVPTRASIDGLLALLPEYFLDAVLSEDRRRGEISFGVPLVDVQEQARLLDRIEDLAGRPPAGVRLEPAGLLALGVSSVEDLEGDRLLLLLAGALAVFAVLLAIHRRVGRALLPLVPALLAAGLAALLVRISGIELSPLGAGLEPLVLAVGVEFGVLLEARYREAREAGAGYAEARRIAVARVGGAVAVSAATVGLGFATLVASRFELLQQFGVLVALEVVLCGVLAVWLVPLLAAELERREDRRRAEGVTPLPLRARLRAAPRTARRGLRAAPGAMAATARRAPSTVLDDADAAAAALRRAGPPLRAAARGVPVVLRDARAAARRALPPTARPRRVRR